MPPRLTKYTPTLFDLHESHDKHKMAMEFYRSELIRILSEHKKFKACDKYFDDIKFTEEGVTVSIAKWAGPDEVERTEEFFRYEEFPESDLPF